MNEKRHPLSEMPFTKRTLLVWREDAKIKFHEKTGEYHLEHFTVEFPKQFQKGMGYSSRFHSWIFFGFFTDY